MLRVFQKKKRHDRPAWAERAAEQHGGAPAPRLHSTEQSWWHGASSDADDARRSLDLGHETSAGLSICRIHNGPGVPAVSCGSHVAAKRPGRASVGPAFVSDLKWASSSRPNTRALLVYQSTTSPRPCIFYALPDTAHAEKYASS